MKFNLDNSTATLNRSLNILFFNNPVRTSFGVILGFVIQGVLTAARDFVYYFNSILSNTSTWQYVVFGVFGINISNIKSLIGKKDKFPEKIEQFFEAANKMKETGVYSDSEIKMFYNAGMNQLIKSLSVDDSQRPDDDRDDDIRFRRTSPA